MFDFKLPDISQNQLLQSGLNLLGAGRDRRQNPFLAFAGGLQSGGAMDKAAVDEKRRAELFEMQRAEFARQQQRQKVWDAQFPLPATGQPGQEYAQAGGPIPSPEMPASAAPTQTGAQYAQAGGAMPGAPTNLLPPQMQPPPAGGMPLGNNPSQAGLPGPQSMSQGPGSAFIRQVMNPELPDPPNVRTHVNRPGQQSNRGGGQGFFGAWMQQNPQMARMVHSLGPEAGTKFMLNQALKKPAERPTIQGADGFQYYRDTQERVLPGVEAPSGLLTPEQEAQKVRMAQASRAQNTFHINGKDPTYGNPPKDHVWARNQDGSVLLEENSDGYMTPVAAPIAGGPAARKIEGAEEAEAAADKQKAIYSDVVTEDIDRIVDLAKNSRFPVTGFGSYMSAIRGSDASDVSLLLDGVRANIGFDRLQQMRDNSPTGGALGQVSEFENRLLQATIGSLDQAQTEEQFVYNLQRVQRIYSDIVNVGIKPGDTAKYGKPKSGDSGNSRFSGMSFEDLLSLDLEPLTQRQRDDVGRALEQFGY